MSMKLKTGLVAAASAALLGVAATASAAQYANVVSATPVTESVAVPRQDCVQSERLVQAQPSGAGALIGAIAGGVIGNQFGHGFGRAAATGVGAVAGSAIGNNVEANANPPQSVPVQHCRTVNAYESRVVGYDVVYEYNGQRYTTRLPNDPGPRLAIDVRADRQRAARSRRPAGELRRRAAGDLCAGRAELQRSAADLLRRTRGIRHAAGVLRAGAGVLLGALLAHGTVLRRAGGDRPRHRLLDRQYLAPRLPLTATAGTAIAAGAEALRRAMKKGPAGPFFFWARGAAPCRQASALATTRAISSTLLE